MKMSNVLILLVIVIVCIYIVDACYGMIAEAQPLQDCDSWSDYAKNCTTPTPTSAQTYPGLGPNVPIQPPLVIDAMFIEPHYLHRAKRATSRR